MSCSSCTEDARCDQLGLCQHAAQVQLPGPEPVLEHRPPRERPILFQGAMVRAILAGTKTQTRRGLTHQPPRNTVAVGQWHAPPGMDTAWWAWTRDGPPDPESFTAGASIEGIRNGNPLACPYGQPGDQLWVRETFAKIDGQTRPWIETDYRATYQHGDRMGDLLGIKKRWTPAIHMPRAASRIQLEVTDVRVERLQAISEEDAAAEGWPEPPPDGTPHPTPRAWYRALWESINGPGSWDANPWVWAVSFRRLGA